MSLSEQVDTDWFYVSPVMTSDRYNNMQAHCIVKFSQLYGTLGFDHSRFDLYWATIKKKNSNDTETV